MAGSDSHARKLTPVFVPITSTLNYRMDQNDGSERMVP